MKISNLHIPLDKLLPYALNGNSILIYGLVLHHAYKSTCYCTNSTLASEIGVSVRTIQNSLKELQDKKCIVVEYVQEGTFQTRKITPLILFDVVLVPENYRRPDTSDNGGFTEL